MSIEISYTGHGTICIRCGLETVEVPLKLLTNPVYQMAVSPGNIQQNPPPSKSPTDNVSPEKIGPPKNAPCAMAIITKEGQGGPEWEPSEIDRAIYELPVYPLKFTVSIDMLQGSNFSATRTKLINLRTQAIYPNILDVVVSPDQTVQAIDVGKLQGIVGDEQLGLSGIRLLFSPYNEPQDKT